MNQLLCTFNEYFTSEWWLVYGTFALVLVTLGLAIYTAKLYRATVDIAKDSKEAFSHQRRLDRPWLFIEGARVERREGAPIDPLLINNWFISFKWRNIGKTPAIITSLKIKIEEKDTLPDFPNYEQATEMVCPATLAVDGNFETEQIGPAPEKFVGASAHASQLTVYGVLEYENLNGEIFKTGFATDVSPNIPVFNNSDKRNYDYFK